MGAELFHADGRTDMTKLILALRNFANAPKSGTSHSGIPSYMIGARSAFYFRIFICTDIYFISL